MTNPIFKYQKYIRQRIEETERLIEVYPHNELLPIMRKFLLTDLLYTQIKHFNRS